MWPVWCVFPSYLLVVACHSTDASSPANTAAEDAGVAAAAQVAATPVPSVTPSTTLAPAAKTGRIARSANKDTLSLANAYKATRVLHFGDSMVPLVANYLRPAMHGTYEQISIASATTRSWAEDVRLTEALRTTAPDLVLISLGSNEIFVKEDLALHLAAAKKIVEKLEGRTCLWIGPPAWAKGSGFVEGLAEAVAPCGFFHSEKLKLARQGDGRHPTFGASYTWANLVWKELGGNAPLP